MNFFLVTMLLIQISSILDGNENQVKIEEYIVKTTESETLERFAQSHGLQLGPFFTYPNPSQEALERFSCYHMVTIPENLNDELMAELEALPGILWVEPNTPGEPAICYSPIPVEPSPTPDSVEPHLPNDPWFPEQYGPRITHVDVAWTLTTGEGMVIAVIGSGVDTDHEDLVANLDLDRAWDFDNDTNDVEDNFHLFRGHETAVIGIAGAVIDNDTGIAGVAGNCTVLPLKGMASQSITNAVIYAADEGADIVSISWMFKEDQAISDAVEYAWGKGVFICAAAGNSDSETIYAPASIEHVMSIGGSDSRDQRWVGSERASNFGPGVDIYAPADSIFTTRVDGNYGYMYFIDPIEEDTVLAPSGTSYATPLVAGVAALVKSVYPSYTNQDIWDRLLTTADTITIDKGDVLRVNAAHALGLEYEVVAEHPEIQFDWSVTPVGREIVIRYSNLPGSSTPTIVIYDALGRKVDAVRAEGSSGSITWPVTPQPTGVYFIRDKSDSPTTHKVVLVR